MPTDTPTPPALSAASAEAVETMREALVVWGNDQLGCEVLVPEERERLDLALAPLVARLAALEADVQRNREQVEQSAGMLMALRTENAEWRQQVAEWRAKVTPDEAQHPEVRG